MRRVRTYFDELLMCYINGKYYFNIEIFGERTISTRYLMFGWDHVVFWV